MGSKLFSKRRLSVAAMALAALLVGAPVSGQSPDYRIGPQDVVNVMVWGQPSLSNRYTVQSDGTFALPLIGRIVAGGLTSQKLEEEITQRLAAGFIRDPKVTVGIDEHHSQRIFVMGEVRAPGAYPLTRETTLIEILARAGSTTLDAGGDVVIMRPKAGNANEPVAEGANTGAEVTRVDLRDLQSGRLQINPILRDGDTVLVPRGERIYILGHVRTPGAYGLQKGMTVLEALALAGGATDRGATNRVKISRAVNGKKKDVGAKLTDPVQGGDTIIVPERIF